MLLSVISGLIGDFIVITRTTNGLNICRSVQEASYYSSLCVWSSGRVTTGEFLFYFVDGEREIWFLHHECKEKKRQVVYMQKRGINSDNRYRKGNDNKRKGGAEEGIGC